MKEVLNSARSRLLKALGKHHWTAWCRSERGFGGRRYYRVWVPRADRTAAPLSDSFSSSTAAWADALTKVTTHGTTELRRLAGFATLEGDSR